MQFGWRNSSIPSTIIQPALANILSASDKGLFLLDVTVYLCSRAEIVACNLY